MCWSDAASLASGAIWHSLIAIGVFYGTRDVLGWHWSMAILLALPASVFMLGTVWHRANNSTPAALAARQDATCIEVGRTYDGKIDKLFKSGMAVSIAPGVIGLLHIWQITGNLKKRVSNALRVGDTIKVKVLDIDPQGRVRLTMENLGTDGQISSPVT